MDPIFLTARFFKYPVKSETDIIDNEVLANANIVAERVEWKIGNAIDFCFTSALYGAYGDTQFIIEELERIPSGISIRARSDDLFFNVLLSERILN